MYLLSPSSSTLLYLDKAIVLFLLVNLPMIYIMYLPVCKNEFLIQTPGEPGEPRFDQKVRATHISIKEKLPKWSIYSMQIFGKSEKKSQDRKTSFLVNLTKNLFFGSCEFNLNCFDLFLQKCAYID